MIHSIDKTKEVFTILAIGLTKYEQNHVEPISLLHPYIKQAWEYVFWNSYINSLPATESLPAFIHQLYIPVEDWEILGNHFQELGISGGILDENGLSVQIRALAEKIENTYQANLELEDNYFSAVFDTCKKYQLETDYSEIRFFLNQNSIHKDLYQLKDISWSEKLTPFLIKCYERIPNACILRNRNGAYIVTCPHCGWALAWNKLGEAICHQGGVCAELYNLNDYRESEEHHRPYEDNYRANPAYLNEFKS